MTWFVRIMIVVLGSAATAIALSIGSVNALWYLCGEIVYCVLFPQLTLALFDRRANRSGALAGFAVSVLIRLGGGSETLGIPAFIHYPQWGDGAAFPFRSLAMVSGFVVSVLVSRITATVDPPRSIDSKKER